MGYQLYIGPEVESWLAALRKRGNADARRVDKALDSLRNDGDTLGPPLAVPVEYAPAGGDIVPELDYCYQLQLKALARVRAEVADAASLRATLELHLEQPMTDEQRARLRAAYDGIRAQEDKVTRAAIELQREVQAFRARREALRGMCFAALTDGIARLFSAGLAIGPDGDALSPPPRIRELRPGAPGRIVARLLFTVGPVQTAGQTAEVFAAATEGEVLSAWYARAIPAAYPEYGLRVSPVSGAAAPEVAEPTTRPAPAPARSS
jgi:hypothetical protein